MHIPKDPFRRHVLFTLQLTRQELERLQDRPVTATPTPFPSLSLAKSSQLQASRGLVPAQRLLQDGAGQPPPLSQQTVST